MNGRIYALLALRNQVQSLQHQVETLIAMEESAAAYSVQPEDQTVCAHPEDKRVDLTTFGTDPSFRCLVCGEKVKGAA